MTFCILAGTAVAGADGPTFEVASIKPSPADARGGGFRPTPGGRLTVSNLTLEALIFVTYRLQPYQVVGGPGWMRTERYDIAAKADGNPTRDEMMVLVQGLLAERFKLVFHRETKEMPAFVLTAKTGGKPGSDIHAIDEKDCPPRTRPDGPPPPPAPGKPPQLACGGAFMNFSPAGSVLTMRGGTMAQLADALSNRLQGPVTNETGIGGRFDMKLQWAEDLNAMQSGMLAQRRPADALAAAPSGPSIFTAVQEQLGLKLDSKKSPVEIFVIDHAERPSEN